MFLWIVSFPDQTLPLPSFFWIQCPEDLRGATPGGGRGDLVLLGPPRVLAGVACWGEGPEQQTVTLDLVHPGLQLREHVCGSS